MTARADWRESAACRGVGPAPFFPSSTGVHHRAQAQAAVRTYCTVCPVREQCVAEGVNEHGVWGRLPLPASRVPRRAA